MLKKLFAVALGFALPSVMLAQNYPLSAPFFDDALGHDALVQFRDELRQAAQAGDAEMIKSLSCAEVSFGFGMEAGPDSFDQVLEHSPDIYLELDRVLTSGGKLDDHEESFVAPYWFNVTPPENSDPFNTFFAPHDNVPIYGAPELSEPPIGTLNRNFVTVDKNENPNWYQSYMLPVLDGDEPLGFVEEVYLVSVIDYRAGLRLEGGNWCLEFFLAGD